MGKQHDKLLQMRVSEEFLRQVDDWRREQADIPSRSEAIRRLVERALGGSEARPLSELLRAYFEADPEQRLPRMGMEAETSIEEAVNLMVADNTAGGTNIKTVAERYLDIFDEGDGPEAVEIRKAIEPMTR